MMKHLPIVNGNETNLTSEESKSSQDTLTGLWSRAYTEPKISDLLKSNIKGTLFLLDLNNFKAINDHYGHIAGDHVLRLFADTLRKYAHEDDAICRVDGNKFMTFIVGEYPKATLANHATNIISDLCHHLEQYKFEANPSVFIGIARFPMDGNDFASLYLAADKALYCAKQLSKNSFHFYNDPNAAKNQQTSPKVDLNHLREILHSTDPCRGSYMLDFESFHHVYNFIRRIVERNDCDVQTILFTLNSEKALHKDPCKMEEAVELLERAIFTSLRRVDVSTRYSSQQVIVILLNADKESSPHVAGRIMKCFERLYTGDFSFDYDIM